VKEGQKDTLDRNPVKDTVYHTHLCVSQGPFSTLLDPSPDPAQPDRARPRASTAADATWRPGKLKRHNCTIVLRRTATYCDCVRLRGFSQRDDQEKRRWERSSIRISQSLDQLRTAVSHPPALAAMLKHVVEWSEKELSPAMEVLGELSIRALDSVSDPPRKFHRRCILVWR
jgi:hypothetical protein